MNTFTTDPKKVERCLFCWFFDCRCIKGTEYGLGAGKRQSDFSREQEKPRLNMEQDKRPTT